MPDTLPAFTLDAVTQRIFEIRGQRVMLDADLAALYGVNTKNLIKAVKRNSERFYGFMFQISNEEWDSLRFKNGTSNKGRGGRRFEPYAFTEHGALMLSSVLNSARATEVSRLIINAFVWLRQAVPAYKELAALTKGVAPWFCEAESDPHRFGMSCKEVFPQHRRESVAVLALPAANGGGYAHTHTGKQKF